jgi:F0F1-type ATP synthase delta subunit
MLATDYAKALYQLGEKENHLPGLREALKRRGHEKLLPQIFAEYKRLVLGAQRLAEHKKVTPEKEQTRILLELYKKLIHG